MEKDKVFSKKEQVLKKMQELKIVIEDCDEYEGTITEKIDSLNEVEDLLEQCIGYFCY